MTAPHDSHAENSRLLDLLADRALVGLTPAEQAELDALLPAAMLQDPTLDPDDFERAAAAAALALQSGRDEPMSVDLQAALVASALQHFAQPIAQDSSPSERSNVAARSDQVRVPPRRGRNMREIFAWCAAAASLLIAFAIWETNRVPATPEVTLKEARAEFLKERPDAREIVWTATEDPAAVDAYGDVVWSNTAQAGYMRFGGLEKNDPQRHQYQLWIFDADQDERYPIDGGVFDITQGGCETIVPIAAKLRVGKPVMFAVTVEKPGGVVVSSRERIAVLAKVDTKTK